MRYVDTLMRRDAVAGHRLPHAELEQLHVQRMQDVGHGDHRVGDGDAAAARRQRMPHAVFRLDGVEPHGVGDQRAQLRVGDAVGIADRGRERVGGARQRLGRAIERQMTT